jgi:hypothetical protein
VRARQELLARARKRVIEEDSSVLGFNIGNKSGEVAGQTVMNDFCECLQSLNQSALVADLPTLDAEGIAPKLFYRLSRLTKPRGGFGCT